MLYFIVYCKAYCGNEDFFCFVLLCSVLFSSLRGWFLLCTRLPLVRMMASRQLFIQPLSALMLVCISAYCQTGPSKFTQGNVWWTFQKFSPKEIMLKMSSAKMSHILSRSWYVKDIQNNTVHEMLRNRMFSQYPCIYMFQICTKEVFTALVKISKWVFVVYYFRGWN